MKRAFNTLIFLAFLLLSNYVAFAQIEQAEKRSYAALRTADARSVSSGNYDVTYYRCEWTVDPAIRFIRGIVTPYFTLLSPSSSITMDLSNVLTVDSIVYRNNKITFSQTSNNGLQINFPSTIPALQKDSVSIYYKGVPPNTGFGSFNMTMHNNVPVLWTLSEPYGAPTWWPCKDLTTDKADSIDIIVTNPIAYSSSANGLPVKEVVNGLNKTTYWKHRYPIATYLVAFAVTNFAVKNDVAQLPGGSMPVAIHTYPESLVAFQPALDIAKFCLQGFSNLLIEYPFAKERYAQTQFSWGGGMEHQTNSFILNAGSNLVAHELSHQWFGDRVTCGSWQDLWLNEGFATFMEYMYLELANPSLRFTKLTAWKNIVTSQPGGSVFVTDTANLNRLFDSRLTYTKGGYVLHMLRWKLGDDAFFRGVKSYLSDPQLAYRTARTADLQRNLEKESKQDLNEFLRDWYYGQGYPNYAATWSQQPNNIVRLQLNQTTSHSSVSFFEMPVPIQFKNATRDTILRVDHKYNGQFFTLNPGFMADTVIVDPQLWILVGSKTATKIAAPDITNNVMIYPNPVQGLFSVTFPPLQDAMVSIYNSIGQRVYHTVASPSLVNDINAGSWASGIYYLRVSANGFNTTRKFLVKSFK